MAELVTIRFPDVDKNEANSSAQELAIELRALGVAKAEQVRDRAAAQDFGATLVLVLGTASVTAVARGIAVWLQRNSGSSIEIVKADGSRVIATHLDSLDASKIAKAISGS